MLVSGTLTQFPSQALATLLGAGTYSLNNSGIDCFNMHTIVFSVDGNTTRLLLTSTVYNLSKHTPATTALYVTWLVKSDSVEIANSYIVLPFTGINIACYRKTGQ